MLIPQQYDNRYHCSIIRMSTFQKLPSKCSTFHLIEPHSHRQSTLPPIHSFSHFTSVSHFVRLDRARFNSSAFSEMFTLPPKLKNFLRINSLTIFTILAVIFAVLTGVLIREFHDDFQGTFTPRVLAQVKFLGDLFLQMIRCLILPLIVCSLVCAIGNLNAKLNKFIGGYGVLYYMSTTLLAIILGIIMALTIRPGERYVRNIVEGDMGQNETARTNAFENLLDLVRNMFPENPVQATMEQYKTELSKPTDPLLGQWSIFVV